MDSGWSFIVKEGHLKSVLYVGNSDLEDAKRIAFAHIGHDPLRPSARNSCRDQDRSKLDGRNGGTSACVAIG